MDESLLLDVCSQDIIRRAFERAEFTKYDGAFFQEEAFENNEFTLRDVLFAETHPVQYVSSYLVHSWIRHLRGCLKHAFSILQIILTESGHNPQRWVEDMERAVLFDLLENWSAGAYYRIWDDLSFETEDPFISISTLDILLAISALMYQQTSTKDKSQTIPNSGINHQSSTLFNLPDDILVMEILLRSLPRSRILSHVKNEFEYRRNPLQIPDD